MNKSKIEWTDTTWNPIRGCSRISPGCVNCYAESIAARFSGEGQPFEGFARRTAAGGRWTSKMALLPDKLAEPLSWRKPRRVFVNSMSDLFHEGLSDEAIAAVFGVMAACPQHVFQVLTKRAERLILLSEKVGLETFEEAVARAAESTAGIVWDSRGQERHLYPANAGDLSRRRLWPGWPLPNVWLGVSAERRKEWLERVEHLRSAPAAVRFVSAEPLLEDLGDVDCSGISWVICGAESGHGARLMDAAWMRSLKEQCVAAGVPYFGKQMGRVYVSRKIHVGLSDHKGGDPAEWPEDLRVREMP